ncbi:hypothetical protein MMC19_001820 [Ptychographa xylographoides]|nr:hypothetical protein [Ptychographa xylographoides]
MSTSTIGLPRLLFAPATGTWTLPFAACYLALSHRVISSRLKHQKFLGDRVVQKSSSDEQSDPDPLFLASRTHLNFVENVPLAFVLALVAELNGANKAVVNYSMATLLMLRVVHAFGMQGPETVGIGRPIGYYGNQGWFAGMAA